MTNPPAKICFGTKLELSISTSPGVGTSATINPTKKPIMNNLRVGSTDKKFNGTIF